MKKIILKITCVISCIVIIFCSTCFVSADSTSDIPNDLVWTNLVPGSAFAWFNCADGYLHKVTDTQANAQYNDNDLIYYFDFSRSNPQTNNSFTNIFFNINISGDGVKLSPGATYYFKMKIIVPTVYSPGGDSAFQWSSNFYGGGYSWASVGYNDRSYYNFQFSSPEFSNFADGEELKFHAYPYKVTGSSVALSYFTVVGQVTRNTPMNLKSFGFELPVYNAWGWHGWLGVGGFQIGTNEFFAPMDTPTYNTENTDKLENIETSLKNSNSNNLQQVDEVFTNFSGFFSGDNSFVNGIRAASNTFTRLFLSQGWLHNVLTFALTLGVVAFLLGTGISLGVSAHNKRVRNNKNKGG